MVATAARVKVTGFGRKREFSAIPLNEIEVRVIAVATISGLTSWEDRTGVRG